MSVHVLHGKTSFHLKILVLQPWDFLQKKKKREGKTLFQKKKNQNESKLLVSLAKGLI